MDAFLLKKILSQFTQIIPAVLFLILIATLLKGRLARLAKRIIALATMLLLALSSPTISSMLANTLEAQYPEMLSPPAATRYIAVLSGGSHRESDRSSGVILSSNQLVRLTEAVRLWHLHPDTQLLTTGAYFGRKTSSADAMAKAAIDMGVPDAKITRLKSPKDTAGEISEIANVVGQHTVVIVSSAFHLPRISILAEHQNLSYVLAPAEWRASGQPWWRFSARQLALSDQIMHEYVGIACTYLRQIRSTGDTKIPAVN